MQYGRKTIYTSEKEVNAKNIIPVLRAACVDFWMNASDCDELLRIEKGDQAKIREKTYRSDIDFWIYDNLPNEITTFKVDFNWGNTITFVRRGDKTADEPEAVTKLNEYYSSENIEGKQQELARFVEICGIGYTMVEINRDWKPGKSPFTINVLDPRTAFVVRSSFYTDKRIVLAVTVRKIGNDKYYTCYTPTERFEIINLYKTLRGKEVERWSETSDGRNMNPLGRIPIVEWIRDYDRMGCFERQVDEINGISLAVSDFLNDVDQNTQAIWHGNDVEFQKDDKGNDIKPSTNDWLLTYTPRDGKSPFVKPLAVEYNYNGMIQMIAYRTNRVKEKCNVPHRNDNSGGSTGVAMSDATGWTQAESEANRQDQIKIGCKMEELDCVLTACFETLIATVDESVKDLTVMDLKPSIKRQKNYEMTTKINTYAVGVSHGIAPKHMLNTIGLFDDPAQVEKDSKPYLDKYIEKEFSAGGDSTEPDRLEGDESDQIGNSPNIDGMRTDGNKTI